MNNLEQFFQVAIDGPAASGKSTVAKLLAKRIGGCVKLFDALNGEMI